MHIIPKFSFAILILFFSISSQAQFKYGVRSAINIASWKTNDFEFDNASKSIVGVSMSFFTEFNVAGKFSLQPELHLIQKGYRGIEGDSTNIRLRLDYIEMPLHAKYGFGNERIRGFILAGPYISFSMSGERKSWVRESEVFTRRYSIIDRNPRYERLDYGLSFGGGVYLNKHFFVDVRCTIGIYGGLDRFDYSYSDSYHPKNRGLQIGVGYKFGD